MSPSGRLITFGRTFHPNMLQARDVGRDIVCKNPRGGEPVVRGKDRLINDGPTNR